MAWWVWYPGTTSVISQPPVTPVGTCTQVVDTQRHTQRHIHKHTHAQTDTDPHIHINARIFLIVSGTGAALLSITLKPRA